MNSDDLFPKRKIGIIGVGMVGGALAIVLDSPILYDTGKGIGSLDEINEADVIFICVPTPYDEEKGGFDLSIVEETIDGLTGEKIIVIKSTVLPGATADFQERFPHHTILFNPEFLVEATAEEDMRNPERQIVGFTEKSESEAEYVMSLLPEAPFKKTLPATEAEVIKYYGNTFLATKVIFANQMYDLCQAMGVDYDMVTESVAKDSRIGGSHMDINHGAKRGYGGKCFPKDTRAMIQKGDELGAEMKLLKVVEEINNTLRGKSE